MHQHEYIFDLEGRIKMAVKEVSNENEPGSDHTDEEYFPPEIGNSLGEDVLMFHQEEEEEELLLQESDNRLVEDIPISNQKEEEELFPPQTDILLVQNVPLHCSDSTWRQLSFNAQYKNFKLN